MWLARSKSGILYGFLDKPFRSEELGECDELKSELDYQPLPFLFEYDTRKDITWENSPMEVKI